MKISPELLKILTCPISGGELEYDKNSSLLISRKAKVTFPVIDGVPMLLTSEARPCSLDFLDTILNSKELKKELIS